MVFNRDLYLQKLIRADKNDMIKIITGVRRCGVALPKNRTD